MTVSKRLYDLYCDFYQYDREMASLIRDIWLDAQDLEQEYAHNVDKVKKLEEEIAWIKHNEEDVAP